MISSFQYLYRYIVARSTPQVILWSLCGLILCGCELPFAKFEPIPTDPNVDTQLPEFVEGIGLQVEGKISDPGPAIIQFGHVWGSTETPDLSMDKLTSFTSSIDSFTSVLTDLNYTTPIYVRSYALDENQKLHYGPTQVFEFEKDQWYRMPDLPFPGRNNPVGFVVKGEYYIGTGFGPEFQSLRDFWKYNPQSGSWTQLPDFPGLPRGRAAGFVVDDQIYLGSGTTTFWPHEGTYLKDFYRFDIVSGQWEEVNSLPEEAAARDEAFGIGLNEFGYLFGGRKTGYKHLQEFYRYNPALDQWSLMDTIPTKPRYSGRGFIIEGKIYFGTGTGTNTCYFPDLWEYDPQTERWTQMRDLPRVVLTNGIGFSIGNKGYIGLGGNGVPDESGESYDEIFVIDLGLNSWREKKSLPVEKGAARGFSLNGVGFVIGGCNQLPVWDCVPESDFWMYIPD